MPLDSEDVDCRCMLFASIVCIDLNSLALLEISLDREINGRRSLSSSDTKRNINTQPARTGLID